MAALTMTHFRHGAGDAFARVAPFLKEAFRVVEEMRATRRAVRELGSLDDRTLHDIGFHRSEIESVAGRLASRRSFRP